MTSLDQSLRVQGFFTEHVDLFEQGTSFTLIHVQKSAEDEQANGFAETGTIANEVEAILTRAGMNVSTKTLYGDVGDVIAEHAEEENYDMIVMGSPRLQFRLRHAARLRHDDGCERV